MYMFMSVKKLNKILLKLRSPDIIQWASVESVGLYLSCQFRFKKFVSLSLKVYSHSLSSSKFKRIIK